MKLKTLEKKLALARTEEGRLTKQTEQLRLSAATAKQHAQTLKVQLKQTKLKAKKARHAAKGSKRSLITAARALETAQTQVAFLRKKLEKARKKAQSKKKTSNRTKPGKSAPAKAPSNRMGQNGAARKRTSAGNHLTKTTEAGLPVPVA